MKTGMIVMVWCAGGLMALAQGTSAPPAVVAKALVNAGSAAEVGSLLASGRDCLREGKFAEAVALFEKARSLDPSSHEAAFGLSSAFIETQRYGEALPLLETLNREVPDNPMVKNNLAWVLLNLKDRSGESIARAIKLARAALIDVPSDYSIWNTLGEAYYAAGDFEKAMRAAQSGLRLSVLAGLTNSPCRELVSRCRKAAGAASLERMNSDRQE